MSFPTFRYDEAKAPKVVAMLTEASRDIATLLGCTQFPLAAPAAAPAGARKPRR